MPASFLKPGACFKQITLFFFLTRGLLVAQNDSLLLDRDFEFRNGIYTSIDAVIHNSPEHPGALLSREMLKHPDTIAAVSNNGRLSINYYGFHKLILLGGLCTFYIETQPSSIGGAEMIMLGQPSIAFGSNKVKTELYCLDVRSGIIELLSTDLMADILQRDQELLADFLAQSKKRQKQTLYAYVLQYNARHPFYIRSR